MTMQREIKKRIHRKRRMILSACLLCMLFFFISCAKEDSAKMKWSLPGGKGKRDNTPFCIEPKEDGKRGFSNQDARIDDSNAEEGYVIAVYTGQNKKVKLQITGSDEVTYTYELFGSGKKEVFPLSAGDGNYLFGIYENIDKNQYAMVLSGEERVKLKDAFLPFLVPNQYVHFNQKSLCVEQAKRLARPANTDLDVVSNVYNYIIQTVSYDEKKAEEVQAGYLPDPDETLKSRTGICLDYSSLMTAMLRSQKIPTRMEVGFAGEAYHAWISSYVDNIGWVNGVIRFDGVNWELMDPTFAASSGEAELKRFIGDGDNYKLKYIY